MGLMTIPYYMEILGSLAPNTYDTNLNFMHFYFRGIPSKLPYIFALLDQKKNVFFSNDPCYNMRSFSEFHRRAETNWL